jgi:predicted nucleotidyltransferase component of viral defense system
MSVRKFLLKLLRYTLCLAAGLLAFAACGYTDYRLWPLDLPSSAHPRMPVTVVKGKRLIVPFSPEVPAAEIATFSDQMEAFLRFEYLRGREAREGHDTSHLYLTALNTKKGPQYKIFLVTDNDLLAAEPQVASLKGRNLITHYEFQTWSQKEFNYYQQQSHMFDVVYDVPTEQKLESLTSSKLLPALAQFLIFKSQTDNRVVDKSDSAARPLTRDQAMQLAADILDVAHFYDLPLDYFMGVGAMENDYMDVNGDLTHAVWKKRAERGDIVLQRTRKRVKVSDYAMGTWQITRQTLRAAHQLYLHDKRDYSQLPARLRPSRELDLNNISDAVLTTYAGLLLRDLLDHFGGDVEKAIGAYNGGIRTPNPAYASSVKNIADYARRILEHATAQDDPNAKAKNPDKSQPAAACKPAAPGDAQSANSNNCVAPATPSTTIDATPNTAPQAKPPYRRSDD